MNALLSAMGTQSTATSSSASTAGSMTTTFITFALIILIFYFLIIRPQRKRDKDAKSMLAAMKKGDKIVTIGGIRGTIVSVKETTVIVKVDDNTRIEFSKNAVAQILEKRPESSTEKGDKPERKIESSAKKKSEKQPLVERAEPDEQEISEEEASATADEQVEKKETN